MELWIPWMACVYERRRACGRNRTFLWMVIALIGFSIRSELLGVTSFVRACALYPSTYRSLLRLFHSTTVNLATLTALWIKVVLKKFTPVTFQGRHIP